MISWIFSAIVLGAVLTATLVQGMRRAILALWIAGIATGCIFLTVGAEALAVIQWIISTLIAIALFFFAVMFGEYESKQSELSNEKRTLRERLNRKTIVSALIATVIGAAFAFIIYLGASDLPGGQIPASAAGNDLASLGRVMVENHIISLEVLALTLFLILVGGGVVARPESSDDLSRSDTTSQSGGNPC